mmetsp:Transcript_14056/g.21299  ORF Transcript_14056/g.21299 Transcript_14056/m.21299 type:complete len:775 (-) Transcript_14056:439-2763(-)
MIRITERQGEEVLGRNVKNSRFERNSPSWSNDNSKNEAFGAEFRVSDRISKDFSNLLLNNSPERSTSAPPPNLSQEGSFGVRPKSNSVHSRQARERSTIPQRNSDNGIYEISKRLSALSYSPSGGSVSEIYSSGSPSPITQLQLQAPVAKRVANIDSSSSADSALSFSTVKSFDSAAQFRSQSAAPYKNSVERTTSFRLNGPSLNGSHARTTGSILRDVGRLNPPLDENKIRLDTKGTSSMKQNYGLYHQPFGNYTSGNSDVKRRGSNHSSPRRYGEPYRSHHLPPRYGEPLRNNSASSVVQSVPYSMQQSILQQLMEQQALNNAHVGASNLNTTNISAHLSQMQQSYRGEDSQSSHMNNASRRGKGGSNYKARRGGRGGNGGGRGGNSGGKKSERGGRPRRGNGRGGGGGNHSMEINAIGIGSRMHVRWVEAFGTTKTAHVSLEDVAKRGMTVDLAMDQYGSRFIQQRLERAPASHKEVTFEAIFRHTLRLCADVFGNYVVQKLFEHGTSEHKRALSGMLRGHVLSLSLQMYGCRVVQKAIDVLNLDQKAALIRELHGHVMKCVRDQNGNHVIQKCIERVPPSNVQFVVEAFRHQNMKLAMHPYGCRVIQRLLEHCSSEQRESILSEILSSVQLLARNQYGNYVVQHILLHADAGHRAQVMEAFKGSLVKLSKHKFASNVVEKCVTHATRDERKELIDEILGDPDLDSASLPLMAMARDQYANYVVQRLIEVVDPEQRQYLIKRIQPHLAYLSKVPYGKHILATIEKAQDSCF